MAEQILDSEFATLWVDPEHKIVHHHFKKWIKGDPFREVLTKGCEQMEKHGCTKWLSDDRNYSVLPADDEAWSKEVWVPRVMAASWKYWALVSPKKAVGKMNMERFRKDFSQMGVTVEVFGDPETAKAWFIEQG